MILTSYEIVRGPIAHPITVSDVKRWIYRYVGFTDYDERIYPLIGDAVQSFELQANRKLCNQRVKWHPWRFGNPDPEKCQGREMYLPFGENSDVVVEYYDTDGILQTFPATEYQIVKSENSNAILALNPDAEWPDAGTEMPNAISITFDTGWHVGDLWTPDNAYSAGDMMLPTTMKQRGMAYRCQVSGTSGPTEPTFTTEIGATQAEGPDTLVWECVGQTVPQDIRSALFAYCGEKMIETGITMKYPNLNNLENAWDHIVNNRRLLLA